MFCSLSSFLLMHEQMLCCLVRFLLLLRLFLLLSSLLFFYQKFFLMLHESIFCWDDSISIWLVPCSQWASTITISWSHLRLDTELIVKAGCSSLSKKTSSGSSATTVATKSGQIPILERLDIEVLWLALMKTTFWQENLENTKSIWKGSSNCQKMWQFAAALYTHSDGVDVAGMFRVNSASIQIKGYWQQFSFHHISGQL